MEFTPLHLACQAGILADVQALLATVTKAELELGAKVDLGYRIGEVLLSPLAIAAQEGHTEVVKLLLEQGANVDFKIGDQDVTPLFAATQRANKSTVVMLLEHGANVNALNGSHALTPLCVATMMGSVEMARVLLEWKAGGDIPDIDGFTPLMLACQGSQSYVGILLIGYGASVNAATKTGLTALHLVKQHDTVIIDLLLERGANINAIASDGSTPLSVAIQRKQAFAANFFMEKGANLALVNLDHITLEFAAEIGALEVVKAFLDKGASVNGVDYSGRTLLGAASLRGHVEVVKLLLERGANVDLPNSFGDRPLMLATQSGKIEVIKVLTSHGANINASNGPLMSPIYLAVTKGNAEAVKVLLDLGVDVNGAGAHQLTPLAIASEKGYFSVVKLLVERGANVNMPAERGRTPIQYAFNNRNVQVGHFLLESGAKVDAASSSIFLDALAENAFASAKLIIQKYPPIAREPKALHLVVRSQCKPESYEMMDLLFEHGADLNWIETFSTGTEVNMARF